MKKAPAVIIIARFVGNPFFSLAELVMADLEKGMVRAWMLRIELGKISQLSPTTPL